MKILGLTILTKTQKEENDEMYYHQGMEDMYFDFKKECVEELERLKKDHWDKEAFNRLINQIIKHKNKVEND